MEKLLKKALLFDFYAILLTEKQRNFFELHYLNDLSLSEIAEQNGITPQGVSDVIKRAEHSMDEYERKLRLIIKHEKRNNAIKNIEKLINNHKNAADTTDNITLLLTGIQESIKELEA